MHIGFVGLGVSSIVIRLTLLREPRAAHLTAPI